MREIVFDTETTGLDNRLDRVIEIGAVELDNRFPTGRSFHVYINPEGRPVHPEAERVHGITAEFLKDKPPFSAIVGDFEAFCAGAVLVAHNAEFDIGFINAEFARLGRPAVDPARVTDSLAIARRRHPLSPNSLDALCKRYGIDNSHRTKHGALLDAELLAEVYIELVSGKQAALGLDSGAGSADERPEQGSSGGSLERPKRLRPLPPRIDDATRLAHAAMVAKLGDAALWRQWERETEAPASGPDAGA